MNNGDIANREISIRIRKFAVITENPEQFVEELETLCKKLCPQGGYFFTYSFEE